MTDPTRPRPGSSGGDGPTDWFGNHTALGGDYELSPRNLGELHGALDALRRRSPFPRGIDPFQSLLDGVASIRAIIDALEYQLRLLYRDVRTLERKVASAARVERAAETWSPAPVPGYRVWMMREGELRGLRVPWPQPTLQAACLGPSPGDVPHTFGDCTRNGPGCGIYAVKDVERLVSRPRPFIRLMDGVLFGLVELSGKVVEHDHGYRGERARVVAAAVLSVGKLSLGSDPAWIEDVFARPATAHSVRRGIQGEPPLCRNLKGLDDGLVRRLIADYLRDEARRRTKSWT